jgi:hypothetical protein
MGNQALTTYLNDHLAGSVAAVELLERLIDHDQTADVRPRLVKLRDDIAADQRALQQVLRGAGGEESTLRQLGGWLAEKANRLKLLFDDPGRGALEQLEAFEVLMLGIHGKGALWRALTSAGSAFPAPPGIDFGVLARRAHDQHEIVEQLHLEAARRLLNSG